MYRPQHVHVPEDDAIDELAHMRPGMSLAERSNFYRVEFDGIDRPSCPVHAQLLRHLDDDAGGPRECTCSLLLSVVVLLPRHTGTRMEH